MPIWRGSGWTRRSRTKHLPFAHAIVTALKDAPSRFVVFVANARDAAARFRFALGRNARARFSLAIAKDIASRFTIHTRYSKEVFADSPLSYWKLDDEATKTIRDTMGAYHSTSTVSGGAGVVVPALVDPGTSLRFDIGKQEGIDFPTDTTYKFSGTAPFSVEAWVRDDRLLFYPVPPFTHEQASIVSKPFSWRIDLTNQRFFSFIRGSDTLVANGPGQKVETGRRYHVVGTYDGTTMRLYVDGKEWANMASSASIDATARALVIGDANIWVGRIDEVAIYGDDLSPERIGSHYHAGVGAPAFARFVLAQVRKAAARFSVETQYMAEVRADDPLAYWRLDEKSGDALDWSGEGHTGTYTGSVTRDVVGLVDSPPTRANEFAGGNDDYINFGDIFDFTGTDNFSIEMWVKPTQVDTSFRRLIQKRESGGSHDGWAIINTTGSAAGLYATRSVGGVENNTAFQAPEVRVGERAHVVATYDGATLRLYRDAVLIGSIADSRSAAGSTFPLRVGSSSDSASGGGFAGTIDEVAIYGTALTRSRISAHHVAALHYRHAPARFSLAKVRDAAARFTLEVGVAFTYKDAPARFRSIAQDFADAFTRFVMQVRGYKDAAIRAVFTAQTYRDAPSRFRSEVQRWKDAALRAVVTARGYKDAAARFALAKVKDAQTRYTSIAQGFRDAPSRFRIQTDATFRDARARFANAATAFRDPRFRLHLGVQTFRDISLRVWIVSQRLTDAPTRFRNVVGRHRDALFRARVTGQTYTDAHARTIIVVRTYDDARMRLNTIAGDYADAGARFNLNTTDNFRMVGARFTLYVEPSRILRMTSRRVMVESGPARMRSRRNP